MSDDARTWAMIHAERKALAATLEGLTPEQWATASLCAGWTVGFLAAHVLAGAEQTVQEVLAAGGKATAVRVDLRDSGDIEAMVESAVAAMGGLDTLVNQAGVLDFTFAPAGTTFETLSEEAWDAVFDINTKSYWLAVKYAAIVVWCVAAVFIVSAVALAVGAVLFPVGPVTLLSGTTVSMAAGLVRVLWVTLYICAAMSAVGAIGLAISTFTEHAIGAIAAVMILIVASEVVDNIPQFATVAPYLPTHWWNSFDSLLRTPIDTTTLWHGLLSFLVYAALFVLIAWARFTSSDVTS